MIANLIDNAIEASPPDSEVTLEICLISNFIVLSVHDKGCGIPKDIILKLGTRGFSIRKLKGTGLGLYQAKSAAESWGGSLKIESELYQGTIVHFSIPFNSAADYLYILECLQNRPY